MMFRIQLMIERQPFNWWGISLTQVVSITQTNIINIWLLLVCCCKMYREGYKVETWISAVHELIKNVCTSVVSNGLIGLELQRKCFKKFTFLFDQKAFKNGEYLAFLELFFNETLVSWYFYSARLNQIFQVRPKPNQGLTSRLLRNDVSEVCIRLRCS